MNAEVIDDHLARITSDLAGRGLTYRLLQEDILDHICCIIEEDMESGMDFNTSYSKALSQIGDTTLADLQHQTLILLDKKFQRMKKITYALGLSGSVLTIVGALFKMMHWPGASILLTLGFMIVVLAFLPLYFIMGYREQTDKPKIVFPIIAYLSLLFIFTGAVFKIMHWPGAAIILYVSMVFLLIGFLPLYIVQMFKRSQGKGINIAYIIMLLVGISIVMILARVNISKYAADRYTDGIVENVESLAIIDAKVNQLINLCNDSAALQEIVTVQRNTDELMALIEEMQNGMLTSIGQEGIPIDQALSIDNRNAAWKEIEKSGLGEKFVELAREYREEMLIIADEPVTKELIKNNLLFAGDQWVEQWKPDNGRFEAMIIHYYYLAKYAEQIALCEYLVIDDILSE